MHFIYRGFILAVFYFVDSLFISLNFKSKLCIYHMGTDTAAYKCDIRSLVDH